MSAPNFSNQANQAGNYPRDNFGKRERKLLESVQEAYPYAVFAAGSFTTAGGDANESISVSGALSSDIAIVVLKTKGATPRTILTAAAGTDAIAVEMSGDPSTDHVLSYILLRAR